LDGGCKRQFTEKLLANRFMDRVDFIEKLWRNLMIVHQLAMTMRPGDHLRLTGTALKRWFIAQLKDSLVVAVLWLAGLLTLQVPLAPMWAGLAFFLQFIPNIGAPLTMVGPMIELSIEGLFGGDWMKLIYLLIMYAVIAGIDGFVLQPYIMKRTAKVPVWASIVTPIVMGLLLGFWGVLLAAPLLAVIYAYKRRHEAVVLPSS
jgi:predicted PurR-regulated permease PerM